MTTHKYTCYINKICSYDLIVIGTYINVIPIIFKSHAVSYLRSTEMKTVFYVCAKECNSRYIYDSKREYGNIFNTLFWI